VRPARLNRLSGTVALVGRQVVDHDDLVGDQGGCQPVDDVAVEGGIVDGLVEQQAGADPGPRQRGDQGPVLPA
jgi:hypothetical protein